jgi:hypothetical protein
MKEAGNIVSSASGDAAYLSLNQYECCKII